MHNLTLQQKMGLGYLSTLCQVYRLQSVERDKIWA